MPEPKEPSITLSEKERLIRDTDRCEKIRAVVRSSEFVTAANIVIGEMAKHAATAEQLKGASIFFEQVVNVCEPPVKSKKFPVQKLVET